MKNFTISVAAALAMSTFAVAGGDIAPVVEPMIEEVTPAPDDSGFYIGGAVSLLNSETDTYGEYGDIDGSQYWWTESSEGDNTGYMLQAGYQFNKYIAIEGRYWNAGTSIDGSWTEARVGGEPYGDSWSDDYGDTTAWGIYLKPMYPITDVVSIYGLLGYGNTEIKDAPYGDRSLIDESGFQWGVGASYAYDEHISFFVDSVQLASDVDGSWDWTTTESGWDWDYADWETSVYTINLGVSYKF